MKKKEILELLKNEPIDYACWIIENEFTEKKEMRIAFNIFMFTLGLLLGLLFFQFI